MKRSHRTRRPLIQTVALTALALPLAAAPVAASKPVTVGHVAYKTLHGGGTTRIGSPASDATRSLFNSPSLNEQFRLIPMHPTPFLGGGLRSASRRPSVPLIATPMAAASTLFGFDGLTAYDQLHAGTGIYTASQYSLEPPDQALAVGNGFVLEAINNALAVYKTDGTLASGPTPINQFFQQAPEFNPNSGTYGESFSDPRAYYDPPTKRWFVEEWGLAVDPVTGATLPSSTIFLAVSKTSDPTGDFLIYAIPTTYTGTSTDPILPDYMMIGADANSIVLSTNTYSLTTGHFAGVNLYAISKAALVASTSYSDEPGYLELDTVDPDGGFTLDPAITPPGGEYSARKNGTEFFASIGFDEQSINVYALTGTASLNTSSPALQITKQVVATEAFPSPPSAEQKRGPRPLGNAYKQPQSTLETGGFRTLNTVYAKGKLYTAVDSAVLDANGATHAGAAYFVLKPSFTTAGTFAAGVLSQGYLAVTGEDISMPSLAANKDGGMLMCFTLAGVDYFPTAAYATFSGNQPTVHIAKSGTAAADGFTGYPIFGGDGVERWGDYSAAVADEKGDIWMGVEYIPNSPRTFYTNFGTYLFKVTP